jgi:hypothetical protein
MTLPISQCDIKHIMTLPISQCDIKHINYLTSYCSEVLPDNRTSMVQYVDTSFFVLIDLVTFNLTTPTS